MSLLSICFFLRKFKTASDQGCWPVLDLANWRNVLLDIAYTFFLRCRRCWRVFEWDAPLCSLYGLSSSRGHFSPFKRLKAEQKIQNPIISKGHEINSTIQRKKNRNENKILKSKQNIILQMTWHTNNPNRSVNRKVNQMSSKLQRPH